MGDWKTPKKINVCSGRDVLQASYLYNAEGQQVVPALAGGQTIHSVHTLDGQRIAEYDATGALLREYIWMGWMPVAVIESGQIHYIRTDHIERPVFATDATGAKTWEATYRPFGEVHTSTGTSEIRFPGQWFQSESGLHQNWMRDYDPTTGRYIQADPLGLVDGASVYGYARQSPTRYVNPRGGFWHLLGRRIIKDIIDPPPSPFPHPAPMPPLCGVPGCDSLLPNEPSPDSSTTDTEGSVGQCSGEGIEDAVSPPPVDQCTTRYVECKASSISGLKGKYRGQSRCGSCLLICREDGGIWPSGFRNAQGRWMTCRFSWTSG